MKNNYLFRKIGLVGLLATSLNLNAQLIDGHAYIVGNYVEVGVNANGHEGAPCIPDVHCVTNPSDLLGMVANPLMDDWATANGDFFAMGSPESGFGITYTVGGVTYQRNNNASGMLNEIPGSITDYAETVDSVIVTWVGVVDDLELTIIYEIQKDQHYYTTSMSVDNLGTETFTDVYYYRNLDPDNNQALGAGFATNNTIIKQAGMADDSVIVEASQSIPVDSYCIFNAYGANWRGFYGGFANRNGADLWNGVGLIETTEGATMYGDVACGVAYKIESLPPGRAASEVFSFSISFKPDINFDSEPGDTENINEYSIDFSVYPNPVIGTALSIALDGNFSYLIMDVKGSIVTNGVGNGLINVDINSLEKGVYFIQINQNGNSSTERIVIQ